MELIEISGEVSFLPQQQLPQPQQFQLIQQFQQGPPLQQQQQQRQNIINLTSVTGQQLRIRRGGRLVNSNEAIRSATAAANANVNVNVNLHNSVPVQQQPLLVSAPQPGQRTNLVQLVNPVHVPISVNATAAACPATVIPTNSNLVVNYVVDQNGSHIPTICEAHQALPSFVTTGPEGYLTLVAAEPDLEVISDEPEIPSHILDHMYAKKLKEPGTETSNKRRKKGRKKESVAQVQNDFILPADIAQSSPTKVNIIRKGFTTNISTSNSTIRPVISSRPKILQNTKASSPTSSQYQSFTITTPSLRPIRPATAITGRTVTSTSLTKSKTSAKPTTATVTARPIYFITSTQGRDDLQKEDSLRKVESQTEREICFMLTSADSPSSSAKTDNNKTETVIFRHQQEQPEETQEAELLGEFSICSFAPEEEQDTQTEVQEGGGEEDGGDSGSGEGAFVLEDKHIYFSYE